MSFFVAQLSSAQLRQRLLVICKLALMRERSVNLMTALLVSMNWIFIGNANVRQFYEDWKIFTSKGIISEVLIRALHCTSGQL